MAVPERLRGPSPINRITIVNSRDGGLVEAMVPLPLVYREDVPVDQAHVTDLTDSIRREARVGSRTGQLSPVLLGAVADFPKFPIIDGFHRVAALSQLERPDVFATVRPDCTWEDVVDLRILAATTHRSVRFSRLIEWVEEAWDFSQWADKIRVSQAFNLKVSPNMTGERIGLKPDEVDEIKDWVDRKCEQWHVSHNSLYQHLAVANIAAPDLVKEARERKGGHKLEAVTPQHLGAIARLLPHRHEEQRMVAKVATDLKLTVPRARALATAVSVASDPEAARRIIDTASWTKIAPVYMPSQERKLRREEGLNLNPALVDEFFKAQVEIGRLLIANAALTGRYSPQEIRPTQEGRNNGLSKAVDVADPEEMLDRTELATLSTKNPLTDEQTIRVMEIMDETGPRVKSYLNRKFGLHADESDDVVSESMLRTFAKIKAGQFEYKGEAPLKGWMFRVAGRIAIDKHRSALAQERAFAEAEQRRESQVQDEALRQADEEMVHQMIRSSLPYLTEEQRRVVVLRDVYRTQIKDIATILVSTEDGVKKILARSRDNTRQLISNGTISLG